MASLLAREPKRLSDVLRFYHPDYSYDGGTVPAGTVLEFGSPVALDASGNPVAWVPGASDSTGTVVGLSAVHLDAQATAVRVNWVARHAAVVRNGIEWPAGTTSNQQTAALAALKALGIVARQGE
ncbi:head decoration protein [Methylobacterium organophilum]|uniref:head decoration protein n=1 Tax=Methylobacterium organophilum TaxID=410 RepID=UPI001F140539|nr:head decoration protein [Methylobacterium organophilum]UMY19127.1 head decoration protein [Methylobacterium organophilum]